MRSGTCPFCPHERHDGRGCSAGRCECCGPNTEEAVALDAPGDILSWIRDTIEDEINYDKALVTEVVQYVNPDYLEITTSHGRFRLRIEKAP